MSPHPSFVVSVQCRDGNTALSPVGEFDISCESAWLEAVDDACAGNPSRLLIDLGGLTFIDSSGLRLLVVARMAADAQGIAVRLTNIPDLVARVFEMTGLLNHFDTD